MEKEYAQYLLKKTKEDYNLIAKDFSRTRRNPWEEIKFLFNDYLIPGERVLDLGCGNGRYFSLFEEKKVDYLGIDSCPELVEIARQKHKEAKFQIGDALNLSFPDNFFDKIYSIAVLHHIPTKDFRVQFLKETKRVLKPGSLLILTVWRFHRLRELYLLFKYTLLKIIRKSKLDWRDIFEPWGKKINRYYHFFSKKELEDLVKRAGFRIKESGIVKNERGNRQNIYLVAEKSL